MCIYIYTLLKYHLQILSWIWTLESTQGPVATVIPRSSRAAPPARPCQRKNWIPQMRSERLGGQTWERHSKNQMNKENPGVFLWRSSCLSFQNKITKHHQLHSVAPGFGQLRTWQDMLPSVADDNHMSHFSLLTFITMYLSIPRSSKIQSRQVTLQDHRKLGWHVALVMTTPKSFGQQHTHDFVRNLPANVPIGFAPEAKPPIGLPPPRISAAPLVPLAPLAPPEVAKPWVSMDFLWLMRLMVPLKNRGFINDLPIDPCDSSRSRSAPKMPNRNGTHPKSCSCWFPAPADYQIILKAYDCLAI